MTVTVAAMPMRYQIARDHARRLRKDQLAKMLVAALNAAPGASFDKLAEMIDRPVDFVRINLEKMKADGALVENQLPVIVE